MATSSLPTLAKPLTDARGRRTLLIVLFMTAGYSVSFVSPIVYAQLAARIGGTAAAAGYVAAFELAFTAVGNLLAAVVGARARVRPVGLAALGLFAIANLGCTLDLSVSAVLALRAASGLSEGFVVGLGAIFIARTERPERTYAAMLLAGGLYAACANPVLNSLVDSGWGDAIFVLFAAWAIVAAAALDRLCRAAGGMVPAPVARAATSAAWREGLGGRETALGAGVLFALFLFLIASLGFWPFMKLAAHHYGHMSGTISLGLGVYSLAGVVTALAVSLGGQRLPSTLALLIGLLLAIAAPAILLGPRPPSLFIAGLAVYAMSWNIVCPFVVKLLSRIDPSGRLNSLGAAVNTVSYSIGAALGAVAMDWKSYVGLEYFLVLSILASAVLMLPVSRMIAKAPGADAGAAA
ncbi:MFS transporter [Novosphingobium mathurense]|uniref:Predicted arabinose efflux permease, MFS family n=1 Tax=Novosphingobium mathurense TaxID=428990 RepID=A0A1U6H698_9SPHN|nr:MFS transporter [Novosphingobium mathurense]SLJ91293.1 Predicted arabinose efflux permease, MFS family [Novosphingobium mathurense]